MKFQATRALKIAPIELRNGGKFVGFQDGGGGHCLAASLI